MGLLGLHTSISKGIYNAIIEGEKYNAESIQFFTANQRQWSPKDLIDADIKKFFELRNKSKIKYYISHNSYLINLASQNKEILKKSIAGFLQEIKRSQKLKLDYLVFHPGNFKNGNIEQGIKTIIGSLNYILKKTKINKLKLLLETTAGGGSNIGHKFEHLKEIISNVKNKKNIGVCFDTAHVYEAGYDIKNNYNKVFKDFDNTIGIKNIKVFHLNDSKTELNSFKDRHAHIGEGKIGINFFKKLVNDKRFDNIPMIIETPKDNGADFKNLKRLRKLKGGQK